MEGADSEAEREPACPIEAGICPVFETELFTIECIPFNIGAIVIMAEGGIVC